MLEYCAQRFLSRIAVKLRRPFVPVGDPFVSVANDDGIVAQIEKPRLLAKLLFVTLAFG